MNGHDEPDRSQARQALQALLLQQHLLLPLELPFQPSLSLDNCNWPSASVSSALSTSSPPPRSAPTQPITFNPPEFAGAAASTSPPALVHRQHYEMQSMQTDEELATLQKLSNEYEPNVQGPLVGKRQSSQAITSEYANADPAFVRKTIALPQKYSHYRTVKGDGNCGWRAIAFSYFEALIRSGDKHKFVAEQARLKSLNNLLNNAGFQEYLYEDFVDETLQLLRETAATVPVTDDGEALLASFNDPNVSNAVITHFRLLTSAWMKTNQEAYQPFIIDKSVSQYCESQIEPYNVEIEHVGMTALIDSLIKPAGFAVEILYLDRSAGEEVNCIRFELETPAGTPVFPDALTARLLYRPGHYDILYKIEDVAPLISNSQVALMPNYSSYTPLQTGSIVASTSELNPWLAEIPGMSFAPVAADASLSLGDYGRTPLLPADYPPPPSSPLSQSVSNSSLPLTPTSGESRVPNFRPSKYEYEVGFSPSPVQNIPCQTATFRNSHYNPAHFLNTDFQPEMWTPDSEYKTEGRHERHRSSQ
ncbi:MAG: hypothetical protein M1819_003721 [Sarea resinae]|nr:MAG: hypothetical protein M1819_003721 [Sarea resinae]